MYQLGINHTGPIRALTILGFWDEPAGHQPCWAGRTSTLPKLDNELTGHQPYWVDRTSTLSGLCNEPVGHQLYWGHQPYPDLVMNQLGINQTVPVEH